jgi:hypothetical protein
MATARRIAARWGASFSDSRASAIAPYAFSVASSENGVVHVQRVEDNSDPRGLRGEGVVRALGTCRRADAERLDHDGPVPRCVEQRKTQDTPLT